MEMKPMLLGPHSCPCISPLQGHLPLTTASPPLGFLQNLQRLLSLSARELRLPTNSPPPKAGGVVTLPLKQDGTESVLYMVSRASQWDPAPGTHGRTGFFLHHFLAVFLVSLPHNTHLHFLHFPNYIQIPASGQLWENPDEKVTTPRTEIK